MDTSKGKIEASNIGAQDHNSDMRNNFKINQSLLEGINLEKKKELDALDQKLVEEQNKEAQRRKELRDKILKA
jgi:hypothetical protein